MNNVAVQVKTVQLTTTTVFADNQVTKNVPHSLRVNYVALFAGQYPTEGMMLVRQGDQDTHDSIDLLTFADIHSIVANRLEVYKDSGSD